MLALRALQGEFVKMHELDAKRARNVPKEVIRRTSRIVKWPRSLIDSREAQERRQALT
jgi:hypothetical protein